MSVISYISKQLTTWFRITDTQHLKVAPRVHRYFSSLIIVVVALFVIQCISGVLLSLNYNAQSAPAVDARANSVVVAQVLRDVIDQDADTLYLKGEWCQLACRHPDQVVLYPNGDSASFALLFPSAVKPSYAWLSTEFALRHELPYGSTIRALHLWSSHLMIAAALLLLLSGILLRTYRYSSELRWIRSILLVLALLFCAWLGSVLPWNLRSEYSLSIVTSFLENYLPLVGVPLAMLLRGEGNAQPVVLSRIFTLHAILLPLGIVLLLKGMQSSISTRDKLQFLRPLSIGLVIVLATLWNLHDDTIASLPSGTHVSPSASSSIKPEWYLQGPYFLLNSLPEDLAAGSLFLWFGLTSLLPQIHHRVRYAWVSSGVAWGLVVAAVCYYLVAILS